MTERRGVFLLTLTCLGFVAKVLLIGKNKVLPPGMATLCKDPMLSKYRF